MTQATAVCMARTNNSAACGNTSTHVADSHRFITPVAPVAYNVFLEPGIRQFRGLESPRVHCRINSWRLFLVHKLTCGKRREREIAITLRSY